jgi:hypothetical protein
MTLALALALGCVGLRPPVATNAAPVAGSGYVAGVFHVDEKSDFATGFALGILDGKGREYVIPFSYDGRSRRAAEGSVSLTALPPGDYRVSTWYLYDAFQTVKARGAIRRGHPLAQPFAVAPGAVVVLGRFTGSYVSKLDVAMAIAGWVSGTHRWSLCPQPLGADEALAAVHGRYPAFAQAPLSCLLCTPGAEGAAQAAAPPPPTGDYAPERRVVLHYHRPDGQYRGWGLHVWDAPEGKPVRFLPGVTWETPLFPDGVDDFGAYWVLSGASFPSGRVSYKLHRGDVKEQGGEDRSWALGDAREAWVVAADPAVYAVRPAVSAPPTATPSAAGEPGAPAPP